MKGDQIPNVDHITRLCKPSTAPNGVIQASAFMPRDIDTYLSVNWVEYFKLNIMEESISKLRNVYQSKLGVTKNHRIALLNVGSVKDKIQKESPDNRIIDILHEPTDIDPSHSGIYNLKTDKELICELILETMLENYPAIA